MGPIVAGRVALGVYAALLGAGGVMGYVKAGSRPSLIAGLVSAAIAAAALGLSFAGTGDAWLWLGLVLAGLMAGTFAARLRKTGKFMPSGLLAGASVAMIAVLAWVVSRPA